ncbi:MAG: serine hydrolase [Planctomycetales bacterium]|nr:serine hydrolase [Planctomycetales bacterium]
MKRNLLLFVCSLALLSATASAEKAPKVVQAGVDDIIKRYAMPGGAAAIVENGKVTLKVASGVRKQGDAESFTVNDKVHIGSCAKAMTATLVGMLIDDGKLTWDTKITDVFPEFADQIHEEYRSVTISHLVSHYAGIPRSVAWSELGAENSAWEQRLTMMRQVFFQKPDHPPGKTYLYSNVGFVAAGAMLEKITGEAWEELITSRLFEPLGMKSAGFGPPSINGAIDQPWGHIVESNQQVPIQVDNAAVLCPAGTVHMTLDDWGRFASLHLGTLKQKKALLQPETIEHLHTPLKEFDPEFVKQEGPYGFGWDTADRQWGAGKVLMHSGTNKMWYATIWMAPNKKTAFLAVVNSGAPDAEKACNEMTEGLIKYLSLKPRR